MKMHPAEQIKKYYAKRVLSINDLLRKSPDRLTEDDYHDLRVEIKKLKSLVSLLNFSVHHFNKKNSFQPFSLLFQRAGRIRQLQLEALVFKEYGLEVSARKYCYALEQQLRLEKRKFAYSNGPWMKEKVGYALHSISHFLDKVDRNEIKEYLAGKRREIHQLLVVRSLAVDDIHLLRKKIKDYLYASRIFNENNEYYQLIDEYQELIGKWHDKVTIQVSLQDALASGELDVTEVNRVKVLAGSLQKEELQLYKALNREKDELARLVRQPDLMISV